MAEKAEWLRAYVAQLLGEIWENPAVTDGDGDWPFRSEYGACWVQAETCCEPWLVTVMAHAAFDVPNTTKVKNEVHDLNARARFVKVAWGGGLVMVKETLPASAVDHETLEQAMGHVMSMVDEIGPMIATVHGGQTPFTPAEVSHED